MGRSRRRTTNWQRGCQEVISLWGQSLTIATLTTLLGMVGGQGMAQENLQDLEDVDYWRNLCDLQANAGEYAEAQKACEAAIELEPRNDGLWARHSGVLLAQDQYPNAIASADQALRFNAENSLAYTYTCMAHYELGNWELALDHCNDALRVDGSWGNQSPALAWQYRGLILTAQGDPAAALVAYGRTLLLEPEDSRTLLHECEAHLALANYDNAIASCAAALAGNGNWGPTAPALAWLNQGIAQFEQGNYTGETGAIAALDRAVDLDPLLTLAWAYQGRVLANDERHTEALISYTQAVALKPDSARALVGQCAAFNKTRQYAEAGAACEAALQASDGDWWELGPAEGWRQYAQALAGQGLYEEALAASSRAVGIRPDYAAAWSDRGVVLWYLGRYAEAIAATQQALQLDDTNPRPWANLGSILRTLGQYGDALAAYENALLLDPNNPTIWANRSVVLWYLTRYEESLLSANRAVNLDPRLVAGWYNRGTALVSLQRYPEAGEAFNQAFLLDPQNPDVLTGLGFVLSQLGRYGEARQVLAQALALNPQQSIAQAILEALPMNGSNGNGPFPVLTPAAP
jgi:tetratricopeptide (TPR) repeat protein